MKKLIFTVLTCCTFTMVFAQKDWSGKYECIVEKDGYAVTIEANIYADGSEYWGEISAKGDVTFDVEAWSLVNGDYIDFYYSTGNNEVFKEVNVHLFTLNGNKKVPNTAFGKGMINAVQHVLGNKFILKGQSVAPKKSTTSAPVAAPSTPSPENNPGANRPVSTPPVKRPAPAASSPQDLIMGKWVGEEAKSAFTKYFDYNFSSNGEGVRDNKTLRWSLDGRTLTINYYKTLSASEHNFIRREADRFEVQQNYNVYYIGAKMYKIDEKSGTPVQLEDSEEWQIERLDAEQLELSTSSSGRNVTTKHRRKR